MVEEIERKRYVPSTAHAMKVFAGNSEFTIVLGAVGQNDDVIGLLEFFYRYVSTDIYVADKLKGR